MFVYLGITKIINGMVNQIYRIDFEKNKTLELGLVATNELEPPHDTMELGVWVFDGENELTESLDLRQLESLIDYLHNCKRHISDFNRKSFENALLKDKANS